MPSQVGSRTIHAKSSGITYYTTLQVLLSSLVYPARLVVLSDPLNGDPLEDGDLGGHNEGYKPIAPIKLD